MSPWHVFVFLMALLPYAAAAQESPLPGDGDWPVTRERLAGSRLVHIADAPAIEWSFGESTFRLVVSGEPVPNELFKTLMGSPDPVDRIDGEWILDEEKERLVLLRVRSGDKQGREKAWLPVAEAGPVRVELGGVQYNVLAEEKGERPKLRFRQDGDDLVVTMAIEVVDAPHVLWTHADPVMDHDPYLLGPRRPPELSRVVLAYRVIQCRDDPVMRHMRHRKKRIDVAWRLAGHRKEDVPYLVVEKFEPSAEELAELAPRLERIAEETRKRAPLAVP